MSKATKKQKSEFGGAGVKMAIVLVILFLIGHAAYNYIPVAYEGESFKQDMQTAVIQGVAMPNANITIVDAVRNRVQRAAAANNVPANALIDVKQMNGIAQAHVRYIKQIEVMPFGLYTYNYQFDNTATPTGFLFKD